LALFILVADQATKLLIEWCLPVGVRRPLWGGGIELTHIHNAGVAWGFLDNAGTLVAVASVTAVLCLSALWVSMLARGGALASIYATGLSFFVGGSAGNTIDRLRLGRVIDFFMLPNGLVINIADVAITVGGVLVCRALWKTDAMGRRQATSQLEADDKGMGAVNGRSVTVECLP
jgi:signal peptidase II